MNDVLIGLVPSAIGFAISPISIIELILVVFSRRARVNGIVFLLTLAVPLFLLPLLGATAVKAATSGSQTQGMNPWIQLAFGAVLLLMALVNLRSYNSTDAPKVFDTIQGMGPGAVFVLALGVTLFNPKNLALLISAGNTMREAEPPHGNGSHRVRSVHGARDVAVPGGRRLPAAGWCEGRRSARRAEAVAAQQQPQDHVLAVRRVGSGVPVPVGAGTAGLGRADDGSKMWMTDFSPTLGVSVMHRRATP